MPVFSYKGFAASGKPVSGVKDADNVRNLRAILKRDGIFLTTAKEANLRAAAAEAAGDTGIGILRIFTGLSPGGLTAGRQNADKRQVAILTRQLGVLLKAGVPLSEALGALVEQSERPALKRILADVKTQVNEGSSLADALARHPGSFEDLFINMVRAGEASGNLDTVLFRLAEFLDAQNRLRGKIISAMFYPVAMACIGIVIMGILMLTVVPKVTSMFADTGQVLPWNTRLMIFVSDMIGGYWYLIIAWVFGSVIGFRYWKKTPRGRMTFDRMILRLWVIGPLARMIAISRFAKTLSTMLASGVPLLRALDIVKNILGNVTLTKVIEEAKESIKEGESIAAPLRRSGEFPPIVTHMIAVGERTGQLEPMLENVAESYDVETDMKIARLTTLLEPVMILIMGGSVAFVVFSILLPILQMNEFVS
ncbi:MAG: type II secretion system protein GspF [Myxococcales bacterium]|nr:type II secretion system protein GspF [Myxococcales bacterium]